jgi:ADP-ribose pyrophosphatase YjhB (NUDIX family)
MTRVDYLDDPNAPKANSIAVAVSAFIQDEQGRVLMIRRTDNGLYSIPGGQVEPGETLTQAILREVKEETGVDVDVIGLIGVYSNPHHVIAYDNGEVRQEFSICFRARPTGGALHTSSESSEVHWLNRSQLADVEIHRSITLRLKHGYSASSEPFFS